MKRFIITILAVFSFGQSYAGATGGFTAADAGVVTPDIAIGMRQYTIYNNDTEGQMVICYEADRKRSGGCEQWRPLRSEVPKGRQYVGFRIVSGSYGARMLELYWK